MSDGVVHPINPQALMKVLEISRRLAAPSGLQELLAQIIDAGQDVLLADRGSVFLYDPPARELFSTVATGGAAIRFSIDKGIAGQCARDRQMVVVDDAYADARFNQAIDRQTGYRTQSIIAVPLIGLDDELVGVLQLLNSQRGRFDQADRTLAEVLASQAALAIQRTRLLEERLIKVKLEHDLTLARDIQTNVLPRDLPEYPGYSLAAFSQPADQTGGDIYDVVPVNGDNGRQQLLLVLADVTGHGIGPALSVTQFRAMVRIGLRLSASLDDLVCHVNEQLVEDLPDNRFITAFLGLLDPAAHELNYQSPGQGPLLHFQAATGQCRWFNPTALPLGVSSGMELDPAPPVQLAPGDMVVLLTDGFYEYLNKQGQAYGNERVAEGVKRHRHLPAKGVLDQVLTDLRAFAAGAPQLDDLTALIVKREMTAGV
jgi:phosphoserine phosphatase RsbU/P